MNIIIIIILLVLLIPYFPHIAGKISRKWERSLHYRKKMKVIRWKIWDTEFFREQLRQSREALRLEYDRLSEIIDACNVRIQREKESGNPKQDVIDNMETVIKKHEPDIKNLKSQMEGVDTEIVEKINPQVENLHVLIELLRKFVKKV